MAAEQPLDPYGDGQKEPFPRPRALRISISIETTYVDTYVIIHNVISEILYGLPASRGPHCR